MRVAQAASAKARGSSSPSKVSIPAVAQDRALARIRVIRIVEHRLFAAQLSGRSELHPAGVTAQGQGTGRFLNGAMQHG